MKLSFLLVGSLALASAFQVPVHATMPNRGVIAQSRPVMPEIAAPRAGAHTATPVASKP